MLDGGLDGQVTPYSTLLVKARGVDVIIGIDGAADTLTNYANGSSIIATQDRVQLFPECVRFLGIELENANYFV